MASTRRHGHDRRRLGCSQKSLRSAEHSSSPSFTTCSCLRPHISGPHNPICRIWRTSTSRDRLVFFYLRRARRGYLESGSLDDKTQQNEFGSHGRATTSSEIHQAVMSFVYANIPESQFRGA